MKPKQQTGREAFTDTRECGKVQVDTRRPFLFDHIQSRQPTFAGAPASCRPLTSGLTMEGSGPTPDCGASTSCGQLVMVLLLLLLPTGAAEPRAGFGRSPWKRSARMLMTSSLLLRKRLRMPLTGFPRPTGRGSGDGVFGSVLTGATWRPAEPPVVT